MYALCENQLLQLYLPKSCIFLFIQMQAREVAKFICIFHWLYYIEELSWSKYPILADQNPKDCRQQNNDGIFSLIIIQEGKNNN